MTQLVSNLSTTVAELKREVCVPDGFIRHSACVEVVIKAVLLRTWYLRTLAKQNCHLWRIFSEQQNVT